MPVSPADFEFYSRMTGQPIPNTPAGRMAIAPQVYNMRRGGGGFGRFVRGAAQGALAAGALVGAGALLSSMEDDKLAAESEKKAGEEAKKAAAATESRRVEDMRSDFSRQLPSRGMRARASAEAAAQAEASRVAEMRGDASRQLPSSAMIAARQQPSPDLTARATSFIEELQAQGAKEREATATARAIQQEDSRAYRDMVRDRAENLIKQIQSGTQADVPAFRRSAEGSMDIDASTFDDPNVLIGQPDASQRAKVEAFLKNRASLQTSVPQADVNVANESTAAQRASVSAPMDPTPVVRQQPSSGQVVSDVSNVAKLDRASMIREADATMKEAKALNRMIRERDQTGYKGDKRIPDSHLKKYPSGGSKRDLDAGIHSGTYISNMAADVEDPIRGGLLASPELMASMLQRGNVLGAQPSQPAPSTAMPSNRELMSEMLERGNVLPDATEQMSRGGKSFVPTPETAGPFVSNKGREIGALLQKAQAPAAEPKVDQKRMRAEEQARKTVGLGSPFYEDVVNKFMGNM